MAANQLPIVGSDERPAASTVSVPALLARKRQGAALDADSLHHFALAIGDGQVADAQLGAFAMAVCWRGMDKNELLAWTEAVRDSGQLLRWPMLADRGPVLDKHSTGGVGDCASLLLAPLLAACGAFVPMLSGRGLGHTGGTLDKLSALPGYRLEVDVDTLQRVVTETGLAIVGAGPTLAPADRRLYAVRDVTATVDSLPLIVASILGKKLASGSEALVLDVKCGLGANLGSVERASELAVTLVSIAEQAGLPCRALLTDMQQPLAPAVGNALELDVCLQVLSGQKQAGRLQQLVMALGSELLMMSKLADSPRSAEAKLKSALVSGAAAECFARSVAALGGPTDVFDWAKQGFAAAPARLLWRARRAGCVVDLDARLIGQAAVELGAGRQQPDQRIDPRVGFKFAVEVGDRVEQGQVLGEIHAPSVSEAERALMRLESALGLADSATVPKLILHCLGADGERPEVARSALQPGVAA